MSTDNVTRRQEILNAARHEFIKEGVSGARMQVIADNTGVTKAMIHYYFKTKDNLFKEVFREASETLMDGILEVLETDASLFPKIDAFIDRAVDQFHEHPELAAFVVSELNGHLERTDAVFEEACQYDASLFENQLQEAASNYEIAPVNVGQVVANIISLCLFPYSGKVFLQSVLSVHDEKNYTAFLQERRDVIKDTVLNWLAG